MMGNKQKGIKKISLLLAIKEREPSNTIKTIRVRIKVIFLLSLNTSILNCLRNKYKIKKATNTNKDCPK